METLCHKATKSIGLVFFFIIDIVLVIIHNIAWVAKYVFAVMI